MRSFLRFLIPYREIILSILLVGLFVSTISAFQFSQEPAQSKIDQKKLNPRVSSTKLKENKKNKPQKESQRKQEKKTFKEICCPQTVKKTGPRTSTVKKSQANLIVSDGPAAGSYRVSFNPDINGLQMMDQARIDYGLRFQYQIFQGLGAFITSIGGLANNPATNSWWLLYYNGKSSSVGISFIKPKNNDTISWQYTTF